MMTSYSCPIPETFYNAENQPEWLKDLVGESPLLSSPEWMFIADIRSQIMNEIKSEPKMPYDEGVNVKKKLSIMKDNFQQVIKHLKMNRAHRQYFMDVYPKWRKLRDHNIECLKQIASSIQDVKQKCQMANFIGSCVSLIGGAVCLASGVRSSCSATKGSAMVGLGGLTSVGSSVFEIGYLHNNIKKAEEILREDKECSEHLWEWLSDNSHLEKAMDNIRYINLSINLKIAASAIEGAYKKKREKTWIEKIIKRILSSLDIPPELAEDISDVIGIFIATSMLYDRYRPLFDLAFVGTKCSLQLSTVINVFRAYLSASAGRRAVLAVSQKTRLAVGMVLDMVNIFLVCKDFDSDSKQAEMVIKASDVLEKEKEIFEKLCYEVEDVDDDNFP